MVTPPDPDPNTADFLVTGRPNNDSSYTNPDVDKLLNDQRIEGDEIRHGLPLFLIFTDPASRP